MNKSELVEHIADQSGLSKAGATRAISVILNSITKSLKKESRYPLLDLALLL